MVGQAAEAYDAKNGTAAAQRLGERKQHFLCKTCPLLCKTDHFTKTGSGQTWGKHPKKCRFLAGGEARHTQAVEFLLQPRVRPDKETPLSA